MISLFKRKETKDDLNVYAPVDGECIDLSEVNDDVFSKKMLGEGFAIRPYDSVISSPCEGEITMFFPMGHAFGIKMKNGKEILVHIGVDSIETNGEGFTALKSVGSKVKVGTPVVRLDKDKLQGYDLTTMVIFLERKEPLEISTKGKHVKCKDVIISAEEMEE